MHWEDLEARDSSGSGLCSLSPGRTAPMLIQWSRRWVRNPLLDAWYFELAMSILFGRYSDMIKTFKELQFSSLPFLNFSKWISQISLASPPLHDAGAFSAKPLRNWVYFPWYSTVQYSFAYDLDLLSVISDLPLNPKDWFLGFECGLIIWIY